MRSCTNTYKKEVTYWFCFVFFCSVCVTVSSENQKSKCATVLSENQKCFRFGDTSWSKYAIQKKTEFDGKKST